LHRRGSGLLLALLLCAGCRSAAAAERLTLATTTSVRDSGLLEHILPDFESREHVRVAVVAVGSGQALEIGRRGDADVLIVHSPDAEKAFLKEGHGAFRWRIMWNYFAIVGPEGDPAGVRGSPTAAAGMAKIAASSRTFVSRGDDSGTHVKELALWKAAGLDPSSFASWYKSIGSGMAAALRMAFEMDAYTLTDEGTYRSIPEVGEAATVKPGLVILLGGLDHPAEDLRNVYSVIPVNPDRHPGVQSDLARHFATWITSEGAAAKIRQYRIGGHPLFEPSPERH
jgi:tungstate transport system substrate-binding protein